eukprot:scaffold144597_cov35-Tisochrysis_lutea.AAC.1
MSINTFWWLFTSFRAASIRTSLGCLAAIPYVMVSSSALPALIIPRRANHFGLGSPTSLHTDRKACAASKLMSGLRPFFCSGSAWVRPLRYCAAVFHALFIFSFTRSSLTSMYLSAAAASTSSGRLPSRRRATSSKNRST